MSGFRRLSLDTLTSLPPALRPGVDPTALTIGVVHVGVGAFHRAHQAVHTERAMAASGDARWGIAGFALRSTTAADLLAPQDCLYSVLERDTTTTDVSVVAALREVHSAAADPGSLPAALADPAVTVVTVTVTEKGYRHDPATGRLALDDPGVAGDLAGTGPGTVVGSLVRGLQRRMVADAGPVSLVCCDNLPSNGRFLRTLVHDFAAALPAATGDTLSAWVQDNVTFPDAMVDRITPATTERDKRDAARVLGLADEAVVVTEPFTQWVLEDSFAAPRPAWELAGALLTPSVEPYERAKLRLLNAGHSLAAYLGALAGHRTIAGAVGDERIAAALARLMDEAALTLWPPAGVDLPEYAATVRHRFANPVLGHTTRQVAADGSQKLGPRVLGSVGDLLRAGRRPYWCALVTAAWMRYVTADVTDTGAPITVDDPLTDQLRHTAADARTPTAVADALLGVRDVFDEDLRSGTFRDAVVEWLARLTADGVAGALTGPV